MHRMRILTRDESAQLIAMLQMESTVELALDILVNIDGIIHPTCAEKLGEIWGTRQSLIANLRAQLWARDRDLDVDWQRIRAKHWSPRWRNLGLIETEKHIYHMNDLKARRGHKPKKRKTVLVKVGNGFDRGTYCEENNSWLVNGEFVKPKEVTWYKEAKRPTKKGTGSAKGVGPIQSPIRASHVPGAAARLSS